MTNPRCACLLLGVTMGCLDPHAGGDRPDYGPDGDADADSDADADGDSDAHLVPLEEEDERLAEVCGAMTDAICDSLEPCCEGGWAEDLRERCHTFYRDGCVSQYSSALGRTGIRMLEVDAEACASALRDWAATCPNDFSSAPSCPLVTGTSPEGADCVDYDECAEGLVCAGTCQRLPEEGASCVMGNCAEGLICFENACRLPIATGLLCETTHEGFGRHDACGWDDFCNPEGRCAPLLEVGAACDDATQCEEFECEDGVCATRSSPVDVCYPVPF